MKNYGTSIEWLVQKLNSKYGNDLSIKFQNEISQAIEIEKNRLAKSIIDSYNAGFDDCKCGSINDANQYLENFKYMNEEKDEITICPNCGNDENFHFNYDWEKVEPTIEEVLCNECGAFFKI